MAIERTLSIIKPDAVAKNVIGEIYSRFEKAGLKIIGAKMLHLSRAQAEGFYAEHKERPFFGDLVAFMTSGPVVVSVLEGENAVLAHRELMVRPTRKKRRPARSVPISPARLMRMPSMGRILLCQRSVKSAISSLVKRSALAHAEWFDCCCPRSAC